MGYSEVTVANGRHNLALFVRQNPRHMSAMGIFRHPSVDTTHVEGVIYGIGKPPSTHPSAGPSEIFGTDSLGASEYFRGCHAHSAL